MHPRNLCLIGLSALAACARPPRERISLLENFVAADPRVEQLGVALLGDANDANRLRGWSVSETKQPGKTAIWAMGDESELRFDLARARPLELHLAAAPFPWPGRGEARMEILLNGVPVDALPLTDRAPTATVIPLNADQLRTGDNRLIFRHPWAKSPKAAGLADDWRPLAVWFSELGLRPAGEPSSDWKTAEPLPEGLEKLEPFDAQLFSFTFPLPKNARLRLHLVSTDSSRATMRVAQRLSGPERLTQLAEFAMGEDEELRKTLKLAGNPGELTTLTFAMEADMGRYNRFREIELFGDGPMPDWSGRGTPAPAALSAAVAPPKTILVFLVDALRADHLPVYGYDRPTAPELDDFARTAQTFTDAWAVTSWTKPAVASILTGLPPEKNGAGLRLSTLDGAAATAPGLLKARGYHSAAIVASPNVSAAFGFSRGFDEFHDLTPDDPHALTSEAVIGRFGKTLAALPAGQPLFAYLHLVDPHTPYGPQRKYMLFDRPPRALPADLPDPHFPDPFNRRSLAAGAFDNAMDRYDGEIRQADAAFGAALAALKSAGRLDGALIIFVADHGEEFGDHGGTEHGATLFSEVNRIPLLIRWPDGHGAGATESGPASQLDLLPTILRAAGVAPTPLPGVPLQAPLPESRLRYASLLDGQSEASLRDGPWDYHVVRDRSHFPGQPQEYLFDFARDPGERHNLADELPLQAAWLRARLNSHAARLGAVPSTDAADPQLLERLRKLGYLH